MSSAAADRCLDLHNTRVADLASLGCLSGQEFFNSLTKAGSPGLSLIALRHAATALSIWPIAAYESFNKRYICKDVFGIIIRQKHQIAIHLAVSCNPCRRSF